MQKINLITLKDSVAATYFNSHFINLAVDGEKGDGINVVKRYNVSGYPSLIIADTSGNTIANIEGLIDAKDLIAFGKSVISKQ